MHRNFFKLIGLLTITGLMFMFINACSQQSESTTVIVPDIPIAEQPSIDVNETVNEAVTALIQEDEDLVTTALGDNLLVNPNFEQGTSGWHSCGGTTRLASASDSVSGRAGQVANGCFYQTVAVSANTQISLSCKAKMKVNTGWSGLGFGFTNASYNTLAEAPVQAISGSGFRDYLTTLKSPANTTYASVWVYTDGTVNVDDCQLYEGTPNIPTTNILSNPSFTSGADWSNCGNANNWKIASGHLDITNNACIYQTNNAQPNIKYTLSCNVRRTGNAYTEFSLSALNANYNSIAKKSATITNTNFQNKTVTLTTPAAAKYVSVTFYGEGTTRYTQCELKAVTTPTNRAPSVAITSPSNGATLANGSTIYVRANASDQDGTITNLKLYLNNQLVGQELHAPYEWSGENFAPLRNLATGSYNLRVQATDNAGLVSQKTITIQVAAPSNNPSVGLHAKYFNNANFTGSTYERIDPTVSFNWGTNIPAPGIGADTFSVRWTGQVRPRYSGNYTFYAKSDDGVRVWINNQQIINAWVDGAATEVKGTINLQANRNYNIRIDYYDNKRDASMQLEWSSNQQAREIIPSSRLSTTATVSSQAGTLGEWSGVQSWPLIATHLANLKDGTILAWSAYDEGRFGVVPGNKNYTQATIYNPTNNTFKDVDNPTHDMFCAGLVTLSDGTVLAAGGGTSANEEKVSIFKNGSWQRLDNMPNRHWYGTGVVDANDNVIVSIGRDANNKTDYLPKNGNWKTLTGINLGGTTNSALETPDWYPALHLSPRGTLFHSGPTVTMHELTTSGNGTTVSKGSRNQDGVTGEVYRQWGNAIMMDQGKIMLTGGTPKENNPGSLKTNVIVDINNTNPVVKRIAAMKHARSYHSTLLLPNGEVLVLGGNGTGKEFSDAESKLIPEIYNPTNNTWREVAAMSIPRNYHSAATLLQDGRILAAGGGLCGCSADHQDGQIYSPAYLFNSDGSLADRPKFTSAPNTVGYNKNFNVVLTGSGSNNIKSFRMIKFSAVTHGMNTDLRQDELNFTRTGTGKYQLKTHSNKNVVTPGYYFLFAVNNAGVPSVAKIIQIN